jgi:hypothetical protein
MNCPLIANGLEDWTLAVDFEESAVPRDEQGKWTEKDGSGSKAEKPKTLSAAQKAWVTRKAKQEQAKQQPAAKKEKINFTAKKLGGQAGSNPGGLYEGSDGVKRYVKFYKNMAQGKAESTANTIYNDLGVGAPKSDIFEEEGKEAFASEIIEGGTLLKDAGLTKENARAILKGFAADVLTANWDSVGLENDNILLKDGKAYRIDNGATFTHRAMASSPPKPEALLHKITEWDGLFNPSVNAEFSRVAKAAGYASPADIPDIKTQVENIVKLRDQSGGWDKYLKSKAPYLSEKEHDQYAAMLESRTRLLMEKVKAQQQKPAA